MIVALYLAALLILTMGFVHSFLGEKYIITPILQRTRMPRIFGSSLVGARTVRFAWHLTTVAWISLSTMLILIAHDVATSHNVITVIAITFGIHSLITLFATRGKHFAWIFFGAATALLIWASMMP